MRKALTALALVTLVAVAGCTPAPSTAPGGAASAPASSAQDDLLTTYGLSGLTGQELVEKMDQDPAQRPLAVRASVRSDQVIVSDGKTETSVPIEGDNGFYLSVAPYATRTHECYFHNLGTCQGELTGKQVHLKITGEDGTVYRDADVETYANGFVGTWLPRDIQGTVEVTYDGMTGAVPFATGPEDATCLTTLQVT